jgi:hypothetical protein
MVTSGGYRHVCSCGHLVGLLQTQPFDDLIYVKAYRDVKLEFLPI